MIRTGIFYASISGRTGKVADAIARHLSQGTIDVVNLRSRPGIDFGQYEFLIFGSGTYGKGNMHHLWERLGTHPPDIGGIPVAVFAIGDRRHHADTFAGAVHHLAAFAELAGGNLVGRCEDTGLPGLALDKRERNSGDEKIRNWLAQVTSQLSPSGK